MKESLSTAMKRQFDHLHATPEVSWSEVETTNYLVQQLEAMGLQPKRFLNMTGLYVDIGKGTPRVGLRTDIDALWQEVDGEFQANHSCGHDGHMTMALGAAKILAERQSGAVRILFQPAEEKGNGALALLDAGVIDSLDYLFGVHVRSLVELPEGTHSPALHHGAARMIRGTITGVEAHGARPEEGINAIEAATALVDALKRIWIQPGKSGSIKMTQIQAGGTAVNIIPGTATFSLDCRAQQNDTMDKLMEGLDRAIKSVEELYTVKIDTHVGAAIVAAQVDQDAASLLKQAITEIVGEEHFGDEIVSPGGEDFHYYSFHKPSLKTTMLGLGCGVTPGLHHPQMTFNSSYLVEGAQILARAAELAVQEVEATQ
ncbi:amidohydrolase [Chryseomicrobium excrementi]|uniref:Amidohydrolase n=2 Tax=Chryseomicrobium excrementi TaxID=2041346 RepID=A0A2M9F0W2_9BACL|nr:amidohydrolase [Chryseomicrobium excrementi]